MKRNDSNHECLSLEAIKTYLSNEVSEEEKVQFDAHFSTCDLCEEVKTSFSTVHKMGIEADIDELKTTIFDKVDNRRNATRRLFISKIAAGILLPITGIAGFFYWKNSTNDRLYNDHFESYALNDAMTTRSGDVSAYNNITLPKDLQLAVNNFKQGDFKQSIPYFKAYRKIQPSNTYANFLHGLAHLETNNLSIAINYLEEVRFNDTNLYEDATWYLALANVKKGNTAAAQQFLSELVQSNHPFYGPKAIALKRKL